MPLITLSTEREGKTYTDFIVAQPQDVTLEPGKVSDYDSEFLDRYSVEEFENELASNIAVPRNNLKMTYSVSVSASDRLLVPYSYKIQRLSTKPATG